MTFWKILTLAAVALSACGVVLLIALLRRTRTASDADGRESLQKNVTEPLARELREGHSTLRSELQAELRGSRTETAGTLSSSMERLSQSLRASQRETAELQDKRIETMQSSLQALLSERMDGLGGAVNRRLEEMERQFRELRETNTAAQAELRRTVEERLQAMQTQNRDQLAEMRATVDEKLQKTLNDRISESFKAVNERLGEVYRGLGEMQALAGDVGDLKKVMAGVKTRGILGEIQLRAIIEELLAPEQYEENIATRPGSQNRVEFAVRLPGEGDGPVYLPIDAKFPADAYHHVLEAYEAGDPERIKVATAELERRVKDSAKDIRDKYIEPPYTTTFGILFLPFEGLYAEVVRLGLVDTLQQQYRISVAGPTTLAALLNSLQMGFKTLAIQKHSSEVWDILGAVKTEFGKFEDVLMAAQKRINQANDELDRLVGTRSRMIRSKLRKVTTMSDEEAVALLEIEE